MRLLDEILVRCQELVNEEEVEEAAALRDRVERLEQTVNEQKQIIDILMTRIDKLERQLDSSPASVVMVTTLTTVATAATATTTASTATTTTTTTTSPAQQRALYLFSYRSFCRQACLIAGLDVRPIPGRDILLKPTIEYQCFDSSCKTSKSPINAYMNHLKVVHNVNIRDQTMSSTERMRYLPVSK